MKSIISGKIPLLSGLLLALPCVCSAATVKMNFNNPVGTPESNSSNFGLHFKSPVVSYLGIASSGDTVLDARFTATPWGSATFGEGVNSGNYPNYFRGPGEPNGDAGLYYNGSSVGRGGIHYDLEFFLGGSNFTVPYVVGEFELLIYDVDGDPFQREELTVYTADGLVSYRTGNSPNSVSATQFDGGVNFLGQPLNFAETDMSGGVLITFQNTGKVRLDFAADTRGGLPNGAFAAIDGDLSLLNGDLGGFGPVVNIPEPGAAGMMLCAAVAGLLRRGTRRGNASGDGLSHHG